MPAETDTLWMVVYPSEPCRYIRADTEEDVRNNWEHEETPDAVIELVVLAAEIPIEEEDRNDD
jgi:hypothetical protein